MHPENNDQEDFLDDETLRKISERLVGKNRREEILSELKNNSPYRPTEKPSLWVRGGIGRYALLAAAVLLILIVGGKCLYPESAEAPRAIGLVACLNIVDAPLPLMVLDRNENTGEAAPAERLRQLIKLAARNYQKKDYATALALYKEVVIQKDTLTALYRLCQAHCLARLEHYPAAIEAFDLALKASKKEEDGDLIYTTRFYRAITRLRINEADTAAKKELKDLASSAGYFREEAGKVLIEIGGV